MKTAEIRQRFLHFFESRGHRLVPSSSLIPGNDPTLLFTNAGMVQFKDVFLGEDIRDYHRATTSQRCVRAGGKHNDLENVGYTARHHTFFEMLGNFSFGDYFKRDAIHYAWELLTKEFGLPENKLWVTVFEEDDEAKAIWVKDIGVPEERVIRIGAKDNFWQMGDSGPCGPCSEIFYDHGEDVAGGPPGTPEEDGDRYIEIWNLVFMQYNRDSSGHLEPLPKPSVDTGMGLERMAAVLQHVHSNYEIDLFDTLIKSIANIISVKDLNNKSLRVIADHIRSTAFMITDGVFPSNEGRGYVLRRIIRRAIRHGYQLGYKKPFMHLLVQPLIDEMADAYPELLKAQVSVEQILKQENEKFNETLENGLKILDHEIHSLKSRVIPGKIVFKLYDTFGFPADLTADVAREKGLDIDQEVFEEHMQQQRKLARSANQFQSEKQIKLSHLSATPFIGYQDLSYTVSVIALVQEEQTVKTLPTGAHGWVVLDQTPFYAESGGQTGDRGQITLKDVIFEVQDCQYFSTKVIAHYGKVLSGYVETGQQGNAQVEQKRRLHNANNHSATHLLHATLKQVLGAHVEQKGSLVEPHRLRFDFSHFEPISPEQIHQVEFIVNQQIRNNHPVTVDSMALDKAKAAGAAALFGEKYGDTVRVVRMGAFSFELCGGTHVSRTGDIGLFKINSETGIAAGIRRIEAITGEQAELANNGQSTLLFGLASALKTEDENLLERVNQLLNEQKTLKKRIQTLQTQLASNASQSKVKEINGIKTVALQQDDTDVGSMRLIVDQWRNKLQSGVVLVYGVTEGKVTLIAGVSKDLTDQVKAGDIIKKLTPLVDGKGGGRADLAQGGGSNAQGVKAVKEVLYHYLAEI